MGAGVAFARRAVQDVAMVVLSVVGSVAEFAPGLKAAMGCVVAELETSFAMGGGLFADVFAEGGSFSE